ncbi:Allophanate hydrolase [Thiomonas arsenitoxydans]|jgi:allophanate hydrolase|uniref:Allophanate hydrolase n=1 Tax=Thiomonas arsenitoxydans (strain DSM 22701 / CIP 110005 / 3As) TaxID=426114 RepID=D6CNZ4_THIA3|nr:MULTISPECIES: allophanate hydrolase [Thiomonas]CAZ90272.1 Allophanate hydrolase [Thiomonas arsenitoxydans]CDW93531.1 putative Allophanate hydrolase [Thiomonas sp. CB2]CQR28964.1 Allophanate hydrolase [Thiomonas arsenitoxydans]CQR31504.1 Allophanate hydrolase [Thiomonas arsenitoxydans]CQR40885.1 Allophanate hydrolase [Thiomonas arsenitoxydans]
MIISLTIPALHAAYRDGSLTPTALIEELLARSARYPDHAIWITPPERARLLDRARELEAHGMDDLPLYGVPFAIKDNIDLAGVPTTCACPDYAYTPQQSATVVQKLLDAGAIAMGKTNLDQFATGLNGTRSPYGACRNAFNPDYISGGSSSGSAVAVALGLASFSLGTDTAGSGRVPAAFNNLVGLKATCGLISTHGVVPACRSLDVVSIFSLSAPDAQQVFAVALGEDAADAYSRAALPHGFDFGRAAQFRFGVPARKDLQFFGDAESERLFDAAVERLKRLGGEAVEIDFAPFMDTARLLYGGPWVAERYQAIRAFVDAKPEALFPVTREITLGGAKPLAADAFAAQYRLRDLQRQCAPVWDVVDCIVTPTAGTIYTRAEMLAEPLARNTDLGLYTNFMNLLDYAAIAVPAGFRADGLPLGITLFAPAHQDVPLLHLADLWQDDRALPCGAVETEPPVKPVSPVVAIPSGQVRVAVVGAHLSGLPLNGQLTSRGARLLRATRTAPHYKFYALPDGKRPGLIRVVSGGASIACEVWELPATAFGSFVAGIPAPLGIGSVQLEDGSSVAGFICEGIGIEGAKDITALAGWKAYLQT